MAHYGTLRTIERAGNDADDIRGAKLYGRDDEKLGTIDDVIFDHESGDIRYAVVDTGGWLSSKQFLVPADRIEVRGDGAASAEELSSHGDAGDLDYRIDLSKAEIERFPAYDADAHHRDGRFDNDRFRDYEDRYRESAGEYFADSSILHRADSANLITPPDMPANPGADTAGPTIDARIHHQFTERSAGPMNTSPTAWGDHQNDRRLEIQPELRINRPDVETTSTASVDDEIDSGRGASSGASGLGSGTRSQQGGGFGNSQSALGSSEPAVAANIGARESGSGTRSADRRNEPFRNDEVGGLSRKANDLERRNMQKEEELYKESRRGERLAGEYAGAGSSPSGTELRGNAPNASDSEMRTAEGDAVFNNADPQAAYLRKRSGSTSSSSVTPMQQGEARGFERQYASQSSPRWSRFQNRLREQRGAYTAECSACSADEHRTDRGLHGNMRSDRGLRNTEDKSDKIA